MRHEGTRARAWASFKVGLLGAIQGVFLITFRCEASPSAQKEDWTFGVDVFVFGGGENCPFGRDEDNTVLLLFTEGRPSNTRPGQVRLNFPLASSSPPSESLREAPTPYLLFLLESETQHQTLESCPRSHHQIPTRIQSETTIRPKISSLCVDASVSLEGRDRSLQIINRWQQIKVTTVSDYYAFKLYDITSAAELNHHHLNMGFFLRVSTRVQS